MVSVTHKTVGHQSNYYSKIVSNLNTLSNVNYLSNLDKDHVNGSEHVNLGQEHYHSEHATNTVRNYDYFASFTRYTATTDDS